MDRADPVSALDEHRAAALVPERDPHGHKGMFGRVSVVAGSLDYAGAALMAGAAALRAGAGLVTLFVPASLQPYIVGRVPELITRALPETAPGEIDGRAAAECVSELEHDALLIGPGLRPGAGTTAVVKRLLATAGAPAVIDAGALEALSRVPRWWARVARECVLTPHAGEMGRLGVEPGSDAEGRRAAAALAAGRWGQVVLLKGAGTVVASPGGALTEASFVVPALASAGTGDVLAGIIASLVAQGLAPEAAAILGVYLHGRAGEHVSERFGDAGLMATDLLAEIPRIRRHLRDVRERDGGSPLGFGAPPSPAGR
jgi:NAD(P)H-hydrate epimerase